MLTILLADDDILTLNQLNMFLKDRKDASVIGQATDGESALSWLNSEIPPSVLILDMEMPKKNGLEILKFIKEQKITTVVLVLSNYDNFEYVKPALHLGAWDYILKHELTAHVLYEKLTEISAHLEERQILLKHNELALSISKQQFISNLALNRLIPPESLSYMLSTDDFHGKQHLLLLLQITNYITIYQNFQNNKYQMIDTVQNFLSTLVNSLRKGIVTHIATGEFLIYVNLYSEHSSAKLYEIRSLYTYTVTNGLKRYFNIHTLCESTILYDTVDRLRSHCLKLHHELNYKCISSEAQTGTQAIHVISIYQEKDLMDALLHFHGNEVQKIIHQIFQPLKQETVNLYQMRYLVNRLFDIIHRLHQSFPEYEPPHLTQKFPDIMVPEALEQYFLRYYGECMERFSTSSAKNYPALICDALLYIQQNYSQDISLLSTAEHCGISEVYLSRIFKQHLGIPFSKYLSNYRIQLAAYYLSHTSDPIKEISSKCGFQNYNYFLTVFKNTNGMPPAQYRSQFGKSNI